MLTISFYLALILLSLNQLTNISSFGSINIYAFDIFLGIFSFLGFLYFLAVKKSFKLPKYSYFFLLFSLYAPISLLISSHNFLPSQVLSASFYVIRYFVYLLSALVVFNMADKNILSREKILNAFILSGVIILILGFIQMVVIPDFSALDPSLGWDPHKNRLASTFFDPNFVGGYLVLCLTLMISKLGKDKAGKGRKENLGDAIKVLILLLALVLTFSRSAWGMLAVVVLILGLFKSRKLLIAFFFLSFLVYFAIPRVQTRISGITDPADSASLRIESWSNTIRIIKDNFMLGTGFNTFRYVQKEYGFLTPDNLDVHSGSGSDSSMLLAFATTGIFGFLLYILAFLFPLIDSFLKKGNGWLTILCLVFGLLLESQFINSLFYPQIMFLFLCSLFVIPLRS